VVRSTRFETLTISRLEGAIHFVYDNNNVDYLVFGVDNKEQLIEDIEIAKSKKIDSECIDKIKKVFLNVEKSIIFPSL